MTEPAEPEEPAPVLPAAPARHARGRRWSRVQIILAACGALVIAAGAVTAIVVITASPSYPHAWCGPVLAQLHDHESQDAFDSSLTALEAQGAPVASLINDGDMANAYEAAAQSSSIEDVSGYLADAKKSLLKAGDDLKVLNRECGQPANAYKDDNY